MAIRPIKKALSEHHGIKVVRISMTDNEPRITVNKLYKVFTMEFYVKNPLYV